MSKRLGFLLSSLAIASYVMDQAAFLTLSL